MDAINEFLGFSSQKSKKPTFVDPYLPDEEFETDVGISAKDVEFSPKTAKEEKPEIKNSEKKEILGESRKRLPPVPIVKKKESLDDEWIVTPGFVNNTKQDKGKTLDKLQSTSESIRIQGCNELKVTITYDELFGLSILSDLFSVYCQSSLEYLSSLEVLRIIQKICQRSTQIVQLDYTNHFYTTLKVLEKKGELLKWNDKHQNGVFTLTIFKDLLKIFELNENTKDETWDTCLPIVISCSEITFPNIIYHYIIHFTKTFSPTDVINVLTLYFKSHDEHNMEKIVKIFYKSHKLSVEKYLDLVPLDPISISSLRFIYAVAILDASSIEHIYDKIKLPLDHQRLFDLFIEISLELVYYKPFIVLNRLDDIIKMYEKFKDQFDLKNLIYFYGILGRSIDSDKNSELILNQLLDILSNTHRSKYLPIFKSIVNIVQKKKNLITVVDSLKSYKDDLDYDIRQKLNEIFKFNSSELDLKIQNVIDKQNLKIAEQNLEIEKLKLMINKE